MEVVVRPLAPLLQHANYSNPRDAFPAFLVMLTPAEGAEGLGMTATESRVPPPAAAFVKRVQ